MDFRELYIAELKKAGFPAPDAEEIADLYCASASMPTFPAHVRRVALAPDGYDPSQPRNADGERWHLPRKGGKLKGEMHTVIASGSYRSQRMPGRMVSRQCPTLYTNRHLKGKGIK